MSSPRRLLAPECDVQRLQVSFHVGRCWRELERKACDTLSTRDQANAAACPKVVDLRPASIKEHHRASCVPVMARRVASLSRTGLPQYRALGVGATPCRLVSLIHTFGGPYGSSLGVDGACQMKVNRMSLALAAFGQRRKGSHAVETCRFRPAFSHGHPSYGRLNLACESQRL